MNSNIHQIEVNTREDFAKFLEFIKNGYIFKSKFATLETKR
ncbi:Uncharacterised protein [Capnocytophaga canimorsus]|nr:Uncharacterised protein [Capnocytophaga canimorsus]